MDTQRKIEKNVVSGYKKIEDGVVSGYKRWRIPSSPVTKRSRISLWRPSCRRIMILRKMENEQWGE